MSSMTIAQLIAQLRSQIADKLSVRNAHATELETLRGTDSVTDEQRARITELRSLKDGLDNEIDALRQRVTDLDDEAERDAAADRLAREVTPAAARPAYDGVARVGQEPRTYTRETARSGRSWFADAYRSQFKSDRNASERLERHAREVEVEGELTERALTTGSFAGLVTPQYLIDLTAPVLRAGRPLADIVNRHELPAEGMNLVIPRGTTGATVAAQTAENTAGSNTDVVFADLTVPVRTLMGRQEVSRQSLERGSKTDEILYLDLARAHAAQVDSQIINGSGSAGQMKGILNTAGIGAATAFGAAPSAANYGRKIAGANTFVATSGGGIYAKVLVMHPRRWGWLTGEYDSAGRPIVTANTVPNFNAAGIINKPGETSDNGATAPYFVGVHSSGLPVLSDVNIPINVGTNLEDVTLSLDTSELHLWEEGDGLPRQLNFEQRQGTQLTVDVVVYSYAAFTAERYPTASAKIGGLDTVAGNGLIAPTF
ncbi:phage major capsid protein [Pseudarthrobacter sp. YS3]|uniref:phage major capsid protein n=1 Tax=Pseudarthrobacter sp. YS3 TaxID=3453718 RepID=UPI003EEF4E5F